MTLNIKVLELFDSFEDDKKTGYGDSRKQKQSMELLYEDAVNLAEKGHGIRRTAKSCTKKFTCI